jgi:hypothetical protein
MASDLPPIDITRTPELLRLVEEMERAGQARRLCRGRQTVAVLSPAGPRSQQRAPVSRRRRTGRLGPNDAFWNLVGIGHSGLGDVSSNKYKHLADAHYPKDTTPPRL